MEKINVKVGLESCKRIGPNRFHQPPGGLVASHEKVLAIVDDVARCLIDKRIRPAAEMLPLLDQKHADVPRCEIDSRGEARQSTSDNDDIRVHKTLTDREATVYGSPFTLF